MSSSRDHDIRRIVGRVGRVGRVGSVCLPQLLDRLFDRPAVAFQFACGKCVARAGEFLDDADRAQAAVEENPRNPSPPPNNPRFTTFNHEGGSGFVPAFFIARIHHRSGGIQAGQKVFIPRQS